jgi:predicted DNA binding CopG/RHH family protein
MKKNNEKKSSVTVKPSRKLDGDAADMLDAIEKEGMVESIPDHNSFLKKSKHMAEHYFKKNARVSFRISETDLDNIKRMAAVEGLPYQTFLTAVIHKLTTGLLVSKL